MKSPVVFVSDTRNWRQHPSGQNGGPQLGESRRKLRASGIGFSLIQAVDNFKIGLLVPGSVLTPTGQVSVPARRAARSFRQKSSSCSRFIRTIRSSSALSETASFHLIMTPPSLLRSAVFLKLLPCAQAHNSTAVLFWRRVAVFRPRHSSSRRLVYILTTFQRSSPPA